MQNEDDISAVTKQAEQGDADAQCSLGKMYYDGQGVPQDYAEALKWSRKAAEQGNADAQNRLGVMYDNGRGVPQRYAEAVMWFLKAAEQGHANAQCNLGLMYQYGRGVAQDYAEAVKWYRKAAEQGYARAQCNLGFMYERGLGVAQDYAEAAKWYRKAAEQGDAGAQDNLGNACMKLGRVEEAASAYREAMDAYRRLGKERAATEAERKWKEALQMLHLIAIAEAGGEFMMPYEPCLDFGKRACILACNPKCKEKALEILHEAQRLIK